MLRAGLMMGLRWPHLMVLQGVTMADPLPSLTYAFCTYKMRIGPPMQWSSIYRAYTETSLLFLSHDPSH